MRISDWSSDVCSSDLLELKPQRLWRLKRDIFALGFLQVALCGAALAAIIYFSTSFTWGAAIALGLPLSLSSTAQVLPSLKNSGRINSPYGEKAFSVLLFQDLSIVPLITIIAALSRNPADALGPPRSEEHTSELPSLMRISYAVFCLKKKTQEQTTTT